MCHRDDVGMCFGSRCIYVVRLYLFVSVFTDHSLGACFVEFTVVWMEVVGWHVMAGQGNAGGRNEVAYVE